MRALWVLLLLLAAIVPARNAPGASPSAGEVTVEVWGLVESRMYVGTFAAIREFEKRHPGVKVLVGTPGGQGDLDPQKLITAVVSKTPPDVIWFGRHNMGLWAPRKAFLPLDDRLKRDGIRLEDYYPGTVGESQWEGKTYALPWNVDCRVLYSNMPLLRSKRIERPPHTWAELETAAVSLTSYNQDQGRYSLLGFAPNYGNSWLYLYAWQLGAKWISDDGRKAMLTAPEVEQALDWMVKMSDAVGGADRITAFQGTAQLEGIGDPFISGRIAMQINGSYVLDYLARLAPDMDFEVTPPPVAKDGDQPISWSGGFSWVIPTDAKHPDEAWEFIKWMNSEEAWVLQSEKQIEFARRDAGPKAMFVPNYHANRVINERLNDRYMPALPERFRNANRVCLDLLPFCKFRPVSPVCSELWDAQSNAIINATFHHRSPAEELAVQQGRVQSLLDRYHAAASGRVFPVVTLVGIVGAIVAAIVAVALALFFRGLRGTGGYHRARAVQGAACVLPWVTGFVLLGLGPMIFSLFAAFTKYDVVSAPEFIGLDNFVRMLGMHRSEGGALVGNDPQYYTSLWNTIYMTLFGVPFGMAVSLGIAMLLNGNIRGMPVYRTLYYVPVLVPAVAASFIWLWLLNPETGIVNYCLNPLLHKVGLSAPAWFNNAKWAKPGMILLMTWGCGGTVIIWIAGLKSLPAQVYEAAMVDGANWWQRFVHITIPLLSPYILFLWIMGTIGSLQIFTQAYMIGAPGDALLFNVVYLFFRAFRYFEMGYACAMAWVLFAITVALCLWQLRASRRWVHYTSDI